MNNLLILISITTKVKCYHWEKLGKLYTGYSVLSLKIVCEFIIISKLFKKYNLKS